MPILSSSFQAPYYLRNGHVQTIFRALDPRWKRVRFDRRALELADGDFLDLDWLRRGSGRLAILSHGLEGSSGAGYIHGMAQRLSREGWDVLGWNYRGCSGRSNRLLRSYHSGETEDLRAVIRHAAESAGCMVLIGFSLGGNITLKYLGEAPPHPAVRAGVAISAPVDLASSARVLDQRRTNRLYLRRFLKSLIAKIEAKACLFPGQLELTGLRRIRSFQEFDDRFTAPLHGFRDAADYWARASSRPYLPNITVPTLLMNARNDPFLAPECFPFHEAKENPHLFVEAPGSGGHLGFVEGAFVRRQWVEKRVVDFLGVGPGGSAAG